MKQKIKLIFGILSIALRLYSQDYGFYEKKPYSLESLSLKGKVKEMRMIVYFIHDDNDEEKMKNDTLKDLNFEFKENGLVKKITSRYHGKIHEVVEYEYNQNGDIINYMKIDGNGDMKAIYFNSFNEKDQLIKFPNCYINFDAYDTFEYDEQGKLIKENYVGPYYIYSGATFLYNPEGKVSQKKVFERNGDLSERIEYKYDEKGNIIEEIKYNDKNINIDETKNTFTFNKKGQIKTEEWENKSLNHAGTILTTINGENNYFYDRFGNLIKIKDNETEILYKKYELGNWQEKNSNNYGFDYIETRQFLYY